MVIVQFPFYFLNTGILSAHHGTINNNETIKIEILFVKIHYF